MTRPCVYGLPADPREPLFPNYRDFRRHPVAASFAALLLWYLIPAAIVAGLGYLTWLYPVSPAPLFFAFAAVGVGTAWWGRD